MINIYPADTEDFSTLGLAVLQPTECTVEEKAGGLMELEMKHPVDDDLKWTYLQNGCIIKAPCAVREAPIVRILDNVPSGATQTVTRAIYKVRTNTGARLRLRAKPSTSAKIIRAYKVGTEVVQLSKSGDWSRVVIKSGGATGWMYSQYLQFVRNETETVKGDNDQPSTVIESKQTRDQLFRIYSVGRDAETGMVEVKASHIFYDLSGVICTKDYQPENVAADTVLSTILANASAEHGFTFHCKVTKAISGDYTGVSIVKALLDPDIGIVPQTGARIIRDNYDVYILPDEVMDRGMEIRHRKNLLGAVLTVDVSSVVTRIRPVGKDKDGNRLLITENNGWVESANKALYPTSRDAEIEYNVSVSTAKDAQFKNNAAARAELKRLAQQDFADGMDAATVSLDVQLAALENSDEYADYAPLLTMFLYDTVHVIASYVGINAKLRVNGYVYDCLLKRYQDVYVGDISELEQTTYGYEIADGSVSGVKLLPGSVNANTVMRKATIGYALISQATIEQLAADSIVAVKANIKEIVAGQIDADALTAGSVTTDKLAAGAVTTDKLEAGSVTTEKLAAWSVKADNIDAGAITAGKLAAGSVTTAALAAAAVTTDRLAANSVTTDKLAAGAVEADKISAGAVDTAQLAAGAVTAEKIASKTITADLIAAKTITAESGVIGDSAIGTAQIADGSITSAKIVELNADLIKTGTLSAERLLLVGEDGVIYKINAASSGLSLTELQKDQYKNYINGTVIVAKSITAAQIAAQSITGNEILAGSITAKEIDVSDLFADEATVNALNAMDIRGNEYLQLYVTDKVDNLSIGGRNLYTGTQNFDGDGWIDKTGWTEDGSYNGCLVYKRTTRWSGIRKIIALEANTQYTLSAWLKQTDGGTVRYHDNDLNHVLTSDKSGQVVEVGTDWSRCHITFTISTAGEYCPRFEQSVADQTIWVAGLKLEKGNKPTDWSPAPEDVNAALNQQAAEFANIVTRIDGDLSSLQSQVDGSITTWFYEVAPTLENVPAKDWTTEDDKNVHLGDLYYDTVTGYCYRWQVQNKVYGWQRITDTDVTKALADAKNAQDTADGKRRVFIVEPTPPYDVGDVWMQGADGDILRCQTKKIEGQSYAAADWVKGSKYTNDDKANEAMTKANANAEAIETNRSELTLTKNSLTALVERTTAVEDRVTTAEASLLLKADSAALKVVRETAEGAKNAADAAQSTADGNASSITALTTRVESAEQKITADAIVSTVTSSTSYKTLSSTAEAAKSTAEAAQSGIDNLSIGGRNLLKNTKELVFENADYMLGGAPVWDKGDMVPGETYALSFDGVLPEGCTSWYANLLTTPYPGLGMEVNFKQGTDGRWRGTGVCPEIPENWDGYIGFYSFPFDSGKTAKIWNIKLEKGNKPTDWSPAPEDIEARVTTAESKIDQKADSITMSVLETKVDSLSIGGTNLVLNSDASLSNGESGFKSFKLVSQDDLTKYRGQRATLSIQVDADEVYSDPSEPGFHRIGAEMVLRDADGTEDYKGVWLWLESTPITFHGRLSTTFLFSEEITKIGDLGIYIQGVTGGSETLSKPKLEFGDKATDWSPAPEDPAGSLSVSSDYSKVDINKDRVRIVSKQMEVAVPSDDGEDDVLRVDADGVHAEVVEADRIVSESVVHTQGAASYTPANAGELAEILTELSGKHLTGDVDINCLHVTSGNFEVQGLSGAAGNLTLRNGEMNALTVRGCDRSAVVYVENMAFSTSSVAVAVDNAAVMLTECILSSGTGLRLGANWPSEAWMTDCDGDCTTLATLGSYSRLYVGGIKPAGTLNCAAGSEVYNSTDDPTFTAASSPSIPTTQTVTVSLSPTSTSTSGYGSKLYQGRYSSSQSLRKGVMLFTLPADLASADNIDSATLTLKRIGGVGQGGGVNVHVRCYDVPGTLYASKTAYENQTVSIDVTAAVKAMKTNGYTGLMLYNPDTTTVSSKSYTASYSRFAGNGESGAPVLKISYRK